MATAVDEHSSAGQSAQTPPVAPNAPTVANDGSTTGMRTHRYLRLSLAILVFALLVGVFWQVAMSNWALLPSISHYFYTPAGFVFVGALVGASLALVALAGRNLETVLLDIAAIFAPLIALVPTGFEGDSRFPELTCPDGTECVPEQFLPEVRIGVLTYATVLSVVVLVAFIVRKRQRMRLRGTFVSGVVAILVAGSLVLFAFVPALNQGFPFNESLPISVHYAVTIAFFVSFAAVPVVNLVWPTPDPEAKLKTWHRVVYVVVPAVIVIDLILMFVLKGSWPGVVFWAEFIALVAFAFFWVVQTIQRWKETDPPAR